MEAPVHLAKSRIALLSLSSCSVSALLLSLFGSVAPAQSPVATPLGGVPELTQLDSGQGQTTPDLMLARVYEPGIELSGYWVSEKLDGVRAYWDGSGLITRGGHRIQAPPGFTAGFPPQPLDGELWMGPGQFEAVSGTVRRLEPDPRAWADVRYYVFDLPTSSAPFSDRQARLAELVAATASPRLVLVEQTPIADHGALMARLDAVRAVGGEGLILHRIQSPYRGGRSFDLLKLKPYEDAEAQVIGHVPGQGKYQGMLGSLIVKDGEGRTFRIGTGFSDAERRDPPPLGSEVTYKHQGRTQAGIPRFASFLRMADPDR